MSIISIIKGIEGYFMIYPLSLHLYDVEKNLADFNIMFGRVVPDFIVFVQSFFTYLFVGIAISSTVIFFARIINHKQIKNNIMFYIILLNCLSWIFKLEYGFQKGYYINHRQIYLILIYPQFGISTLSYYFREINSFKIEKKVLEKDFDMFMKECIHTRKECEANHPAQVEISQMRIELTTRYFTTYFQSLVVSCLVYAVEFDFKKSV